MLRLSESKKNKTEISNKVKGKKIVVTLDGRTLTLEFDISEEDMITSATSSLGKFLKGMPINIMQVIVNGPNSQIMYSTIIKNIVDFEKWEQNLIGLLRVHRTKY